MRKVGAGMKRIPITMCHGIEEADDLPLTVEHLDRLLRIAADLDFQSIDYNQLESWRNGDDNLPERPFMFDVDHPARSVLDQMHEVLSRYNFCGNLFINTGEIYTGPMPANSERTTLTWDEVRELVDKGWLIGAHTVTHPNLSQLFLEDPTGEKIRAELEQCDAALERELGVEPRDFAFTGTSCSSTAEREVMKRYRFGRLWIRRKEGGTSDYQVDGKNIRFAEYVGSDGPDDADRGPPISVRYITRESNAYRLPSMEIRSVLLHSPEAFRRYFEEALE